MSEDTNKQEEDSSATGGSTTEHAQGQRESGQSGPKFDSGPKFEQGSDPLAGVKKGASDLMDSMEGKTVSMKVYVGSIIGVVVLMMLARCGG